MLSLLCAWDLLWLSIRIVESVSLWLSPIGSVVGLFEFQALKLFRLLLISARCFNQQAPLYINRILFQVQLKVEWVFGSFLSEDFHQYKTLNKPWSISNMLFSDSFDKSNRKAKSLNNDFYQKLRSSAFSLIKISLHKRYKERTLALEIYEFWWILINISHSVAYNSIVRWHEFIIWWNKSFHYEVPGLLWNSRWNLSMTS